LASHPFANAEAKDEIDAGAEGGGADDGGNPDTLRSKHPGQFYERVFLGAFPWDSMINMVKDAENMQKQWSV
jgi:hypothetical protein